MENKEHIKFIAHLFFYVLPDLAKEINFWGQSEKNRREYIYEAEWPAEINIIL